VAKYTTELRTLIRNGFDIGLNDYPIFDEDYRAILNKKIVDHYYFSEIGFETAAIFKHYLNTTMREIMPVYNKMYLTNDLIENPLRDFDETTDETRNKTGAVTVEAENGEKKDDDTIETTVGDRIKVTVQKKDGRKVASISYDYTDKDGSKHEITVARSGESNGDMVYVFDMPAASIDSFVVMFDDDDPDASETTVKDETGKTIGVGAAFSMFYGDDGVKATVVDTEREEGQPNPEFQLSYEGLLDHDAEPVWLQAPVFETAANEASIPGIYMVSVASGEAESYGVEFISGKITVTAKPVPDGISTLSAAEDNAPLYNLQGQRVNASRKGLFIRNGKKVVK
jgi:hypothetical protein